MLRKRVIVISTIAVLGLAGLFAFGRFASSAQERAENFLRDCIARAGRTTPPNPNLVFLAIDADSVGLEEGADIEGLYGLADSYAPEARALRLMSKLWPWPREVYALVLERLVKAGASVVLFDLTFPTATEKDEPFRLALDLYKDKVVIGSNFVSASRRGLTTAAASHTRPPETLIPQTSPMDDRAGYTNFWPDEDEVVRRAQFRVTFEQVQGDAPASQSERFISLAARGLEKAGFKNRIPEGISDRIFRYTAPPRQGFRAHSIFEIFAPEYWKRNYDSGEFFRDKIVLVGAEGNWQHDEHSTPFGSMPGPELHLNAINAALHNEFIRETPPLGVAGFTIFAGAIAIVLSLGIRSPFARLGALVGTDLCYGWIALGAFNLFGLYVPCFTGLAELNVTVLLGLICDFTWERVEKVRIRRTLEKYVSTNVVRELLDNPKPFQQALGGVIKPAAILFTDLRGYSSVSAKTDPQALVAQLNEYLGAMVECVFRYGGTLDKFIGDAVMAVWGNVQSDGVQNDTANAVRAALAMRAELARLNRDWRKRALPELRAGIAVNQGDVIVGNIGSPRRMEFTVVGDVVNISWKLQELTKQFDADIIVSKNVTGLLLEHFDLEPLGKARIPGQSEPIEVFSVLDQVDVAQGEGDREKCLTSGMNDYLSKPVCRNDLKAALDRRTEIQPLAGPQTSVASSHELLVNFDQLRDVADDEPARIERLIDLYVTEAGLMLDGLQVAIEANASGDVARIAHKLVGSSITCGVEAFTTSLRQLERLGRSGDLSGAPALFEEVRYKFPRVRNVFTQFVESLPKASS